MRFIGQVMTAKRNMQEQERVKRSNKNSEDAIRESQRNFGRTSISKIGKKKYRDDDFVDYEELD